MNKAEKLTRFFEQLRGKGNPTAQDIRNAAAATGDCTEIIPEISAYAAGMGIDATAELSDLAKAQDTARHKKDLQEKAASLEKKAGALITETDPEKRERLIEDIRGLTASMGTTVATAGPKIITSKELMQKQFAPRQWIVENLIGPGLTILSGAPKIGKSWLLFALAEAASTGGVFLNKYKVNKTSVLHLSLEDTEQSIQERRVILSHKQEGGYFGNDDLYIATEWDTGPIGLETYLRARNEIKLIIIDTLGTFMPDMEDMNEYADTVKSMRTIKKIADTLNIAILVVHHAKKGSNKSEKGDWMDQSLGSQGIVGSADTILLLQRDIEKETGERLDMGKLYASGRSIKDIFHKVKYSPDFGMWSITDKDKDDKPAPPSTPKTLLTRADINGTL